jgi:hypothetical protein
MDALVEIGAGKEGQETNQPSLLVEVPVPALPPDRTEIGGIPLVLLVDGSQERAVPEKVVGEHELPGFLPEKERPGETAILVENRQAAQTDIVDEERVGVRAPGVPHTSKLPGAVTLGSHGVEERPLGVEETDLL